MDRDVRFAVVCGNSGGQKGIHLRGHEATKPTEIPVKVSIIQWTKYLKNLVFWVSAPLSMISIYVSLI